jgi:transcriptional regulator with XRE-family HTH domain
MSQKDLAQKVGTSQQQISRLESPSYEGHSLSMLRKVAEVLGANVQVKIERAKTLKQSAVAETVSLYGKKSKKTISNSTIVSGALCSLPHALLVMSLSNDALCTGSRQLTGGNGERVKRRLDPFIIGTHKEYDKIDAEVI